MNKRYRFSVTSILLFVLSPAILHGQALSAPNTEVLQRRLQHLAAGFPGKVGILVRNIETGAQVGINADDEFPMASTYKVAIMTQVFRDVEAGRLSLTERVPLTENELRPGSGLLRYMTPGLAPTIHDLVLMMITVSDNEATDLLLKRVGGGARVTATLLQLGIPNIRVDRPTLEIIGDWLAAADPSSRGASAADLVKNRSLSKSPLTREQMDNAAKTLTDDPRDHTSPRAMGELLTKIFKSEVVSEKSSQDMLAIMQNQQLKTRIPRYLEDVAIASKSGTIGDITNDVGILYAGNQHIVISVYTLKENSKVQTEQAEEFIARTARETYDYFQDTAQVH
jgi:beta-lactamase class A